MQTLNTASRLESFEKEQEELADSPCRILVGERTLGFLGNQYKTRRFGDVTLKGKEKKVPVYRVLERVWDEADGSVSEPIRSISEQITLAPENRVG